MKNYGWVVKGLFFGGLVWVLMYIIFPQFNDEQLVEPEKHLTELLFAVPAGLLWGYYRFVVLPKKMAQRDKDKK